MENEKKVENKKVYFMMCNNGVLSNIYADESILSVVTGVVGVCKSMAGVKEFTAGFKAAVNLTAKLEPKAE